MLAEAIWPARQTAPDSPDGSDDKAAGTAWAVTGKVFMLVLRG